MDMDETCTLQDLHRVLEVLERTVATEADRMRDLEELLERLEDSPGLALHWRYRQAVKAYRWAIEDATNGVASVLAAP